MIVGAKPRRRRSHTGPPLSRGFALTTTSRCCRSCESWFVSANDGISVTKWTEAVDAPGGFVAVLKSPWSSEPDDVTAATCPARTSCRKTGLYGTRFRVTCVTLCAPQ